MRYWLASGSLALALGVAACSPLPARAPSSDGAEPLRLVFLRDLNVPRAGTEAAGATDARWGAAGLGGLSGLYFDASTRTLYAVSDDCRPAPARIYAFDVELSSTQLRVSPRSVLLLSDARGGGLSDFCDTESITASANGEFLIGTENHEDKPGMRWPSILRVTRAGRIVGTVPLPEAFLPELEGTPTRGTRTNLAFEGLSVSPSGRWLTAITEAALQQDGPRASFASGTTVRLLRWDLSSTAPPVEFRYQTEPLPQPASGTVGTGNNGVSELLSLDDERLLVLERAYMESKNTVRIFEIRIPSGAASSSAPASPVLAKRLVLDLDTLLAQLEPGHQELDNMEGMTFGPRLPSGERTLLLVSDDNFRAEQRTVFIAFRIVEGR